MTATLPAPGLPLSGRTSLPALIDREHRRTVRRRVLWAALAVLVPLGSAGAYLALRPRPVPLEARFRTQPVRHGDLTREVRATGRVEARSTVSVGAEISGRIATVDVDYNDRVVAGQVMARFDRASLEASRVQTEAMVAAARATVAQARFDLEQARRNLARAQELFTRQAQSQAENEASVTAASLAEARLRAAEAQLAAQEANARIARTNLDHAVIRAPIDGVVITRNIDPGQTVASMLQTPVLFTVAADLALMEVEAAVDEADIGEVRLGQRALFAVNAYPERTFEGVVTEVRNAAKVVQDVVTYGAVVQVENRDLVLKPGMTASVRIQTAQAKDVDSVPNAALHFTPPGERRDGSGSAIYVLQGAALRSVKVVPGISDGEQTQVAPGAVPAGQPVLVDLTPKGKLAYGLAHAQ